MTPATQVPSGATVLVTGASGFTGSALARRLVAHGASVRAVARESSKLDHLADLPIEWVRGDVFDPAVIDRAMAGVHFVFHLAAAYRQAAVTDDFYRLVHVRSTELIVEAASRATDFNRVVHVSTIGVHGHIEHPPANEESPFAPGDLYQATKAEAEAWVRDRAPAIGVPYAIIRPCAIYGPGDTRLLKVFRMASRGFFPVLGTGRTLYHLVHVDDLAAIIERAAVHPGAVGEAFIAGADVPIRMDEMVGQIGHALGRHVRILRLPAAPVFAAADVCEAVCRRLGLEPPLYRRRVAFYTKDRAFDTTKLRERLGYRCRYSNEEGLGMTARWYVAQGWVKGART